jgi:hypothetical protein
LAYSVGIALFLFGHHLSNTISQTEIPHSISLPSWGEGRVRG